MKKRLGFSNTGNLIWIAYTMTQEYYMSMVDGKIYEAESPGLNTPFKLKPCVAIPDSAEFITYPVS